MFFPFKITLDSLQEVLVDVMQNDYGYTHDPAGYLLLKITQLIELLGIRHCATWCED